VFQEGFGDRTTEMVYDAEAKVVTVNFLSLFWSTGIDCTATYGVADPLNPTMTTKAYPGRGAPVQIDYAKLLEADELGKKAGGKLPDKSTTEAAEAADSMHGARFRTQFCTCAVLGCTMLPSSMAESKVDGRIHTYTVLDPCIATWVAASMRAIQ
jgi:hypothetical protein